ncbi:MAG: TlpA family protein disulfide reductase, partial [Acidobacteria bacterium]|nr:TlpA family protein disulfide reductase [Acidobacteriota bacterium]
GCPHCGPFAEKLEELSRKYAGRVQVISIVNPPDNDVTVGRFIKAHGLSYPLVYDCGQAAASYMMATPQRSRIDIPHVFVIDPEGIIRNDFGYGVLTKGPIFEGRGLFEEVEKLLGSAAGRGEAKSSPKK